MDMREKALNKK
jgi:hypothetical protein